MTGKRGRVEGLERLLSQRTRQLADRTIERGRLDEDDVEDLQALHQLVDLTREDVTQPWLDWAARGVLVLVLAWVLYLLASEVDEVEIELDVRTDYCELVLSDGGSLFEELSLRRLEVGNLERIDVLDLDWEGESTLEAKGGRGLFAIVEAATEEAEVLLGSVRLAPGARLAVARRVDGGFTLRAPLEELEVGLVGPVELSAPGWVERVLPARERPWTLLLRPRAEAAISFEVSAPQPEFLARLTAVASLGFEQHEVYRAHLEERVVPISKVLDGNVRVVDAAGLEYALHPYEHLGLELLPGGVVRRLEVTPEALEIQFTGEVSALDVGSRDRPRSLKPSPLERFYLNHDTFVIGGGLSLVGALVLRFASRQRRRQLIRDLFS